MPELPEVEIVRKSLNKKISGKIINDVRVKNRNLRLKIPKNFEIKLKRKKIKKIGRFSKYIIIFFTDNSYCVIHLGMSGTIHLLNTYSKKKFTNTSFYHSPHLPKKHNHVEIQFNNLKLVYNDPRRFGYILFINSEKELLKKFEKFGPEPFSKNFNINYVKTYFKIIKKSKEVLKKSIVKGGSSIRDFKNTSGNKGLFQNEFKVYNRENLKCPRITCRGKIFKIVVTNRSSFFCNKCQK
jgi:formamidopyrimidine-DNA glycosylase